jgi:pyruvate kinase
MENSELKTSNFQRHTKIVATIGPASSSPETIRKMVQAGMNVARLNFSHGSYEDHARIIKLLREISLEFDTPITLLQDLQGPKIRVGQLPNQEITLKIGETVNLIPINQNDNSERGEFQTIPIDYPYLATEAKPGMQILLDDGLLELKVTEIKDHFATCQVVEGGILKSRKGVNLPSLNLRLPSLTDKDKQDVIFGIQQGIDWVSLSFVRRGEDIQTLKQFLADNGAETTPVIAKIEKPQAIANLESIIAQSQGIMVARGDLGVEMRPEKVPLLQKQIIKMCNQRGIPVITATQMLDSMINNPRPTRAEASDVANAILDGTDAVMLSGEAAVGKYPVKSVEMLAKIAIDIEPDAKFTDYPPATNDETHAISEALTTIINILDLRYIVAFTSTGYTALLAAKERPKMPVIALTRSKNVYHRLNLVWGVKPLLIDQEADSFEGMILQSQDILKQRKLVNNGDKILIVGGIPTGKAMGTNFLKIHTIYSSPI